MCRVFPLFPTRLFHRSNVLATCIGLETSFRAMLMIKRRMSLQRSLQLCFSYSFVFQHSPPNFFLYFNLLTRRRQLHVTQSNHRISFASSTIGDDPFMLTYKQSVVLLVSIISVLAVIAIVTGLSPLYWPRPKNLPQHQGNDVCRQHWHLWLRSRKFLIGTNGDNIINESDDLFEYDDQIDDTDSDDNEY